MNESSAPRRAIFLDRDGTLIHDPGYLADPAGVVLLPGVADGLCALARAGFVFVIVTNQSGIARGRYTSVEYDLVAARVVEELKTQGVDLLAAYYCPYHPEGNTPPFNTDHPERKPLPGMWLRAAEEHGIDLAASWSIGDSVRDIVAGKRAGSRGILLAGGRDKWPLPVVGPYDADFVARDFREAVLFILREEGQPLPDASGAAYPESTPA
jgi:D-glycero-D-manno-heptose 1,7-bisphosphate phosphatase